MALGDPRAAFGIHSIIPYRRSDHTPYGIVRVLGGGEISLSAERVDLFGGSNRYPWISEATIIDSEFTFTAKEYPDFLFELFLGAGVATTAAESGGGVTSITNASGTSVSNATTGVASVQIDTAADLKYGRYVIKAVSATTVDLFALANIDTAKGTDLEIQDDNLKITASALTVPDTGGTVAVPNLGISLVGGSGTVAFTTDDTAYFDLRPIHTGQSIITVGAEGTTFPEFGARMIAAKLSDGRIFEVHAFRANGSGMPIGLTENEFAEPELSMKLLFDSTQNAVFELTALDGE